MPLYYTEQIVQNFDEKNDGGEPNVKYVIVTGSSGLVATQLIYEFLKHEDYYIYAASTHPENLIRYWDDCKENIQSKNRLFVGTLEQIERVVTENNNDIFSVVHCAFARSKNAGDVAMSLDYLTKVMKLAESLSTGSFINISSQSVYGKRMPMWTENTPVSPDSLYAMGKYASELLVQATFADSGINHTSLRLASVCEKARFLNIFVKNALSETPIRVMGGKQTCSFIDVRDVAEAIFSVVEQSEKNKFDAVYNLGIGVSRTIAELAEDVKRIAEQQLGKAVCIEWEEADISIEVGMDNTSFCKTFQWIPKRGYDEMIESLIGLNLDNSLCVSGEIPFALRVVNKGEDKK